MLLLLFPKAYLHPFHPRFTVSGLSEPWFASAHELPGIIGETKWSHPWGTGWGEN